jgi:hypothetical protein
MVLLEQLRIHVGGLVCLKTELYWYGGRGWDGCPGRICLILDAGLRSCALAAAVTPAAAVDVRLLHDAATLLLIDGCPHWVWVGADDLELL